MAPSDNRRSGSSRRAQYTTFFSYLAGGIGAAIGALLLVISLVSPSAFAALRGVGSDLTAPVSRTAAGAKAESLGFLESIAGYFAAGSQNARLKRELVLARARLIEADAVEEENRRLKALLDLMKDDPRPVVAARLIGSTSSSPRRFATLDAGSADGVAIGMPVRSQVGVIGRVLEVSRLTSRVLLVTDAESVVPVRRAKDGIPAFAHGRADGTLQIRLISLGLNPLRPGDAFVTSGSGGLYRPGIPIAIVTQVTSDGAIAHLVSDPAATDYVVVDSMWASESGMTPASDAGSGAQ